MVDPEALVLISLCLRRSEPRLWDFLGGFAELGSRLLSVQRVKNLLPAYPASTRAALGDFSGVAVRHGKDSRWRALSEAGGTRFRPEKVVDPRQRFGQPGALLLRLRSAFGVDVRTDVLGFLLGLRGSAATVKEISEALGYRLWAVRTAVDAMADARVILATSARPVAFHVHPKAWAQLLGLERTPPQWRYWQGLFSFIAQVVDLLESSETRNLTPYLLSSRLRRLTEASLPAFSRNRLRIPEPSDYPGESYLEGFEVTTRRVGKWMLQAV